MKDTLLWLNLPERKKPDEHCLYHSIKDTGQWIERTSHLPTGERSRLYYSFLVEVNALIIPVQKRLVLLEQLHPHVFKLVHNLSRKCIGYGLPLMEEKHHLVDLVDAFLNEMSTGYKIIIDELADEGFIHSIFNQKYLILANYHALFYLNHKLFYNYLLYAEHHPNEWLDIHQLYFFSIKRHFESNSISNLSEPIKTIAGLYKKIVLFSLANPYHLSITEMLLLWNKLDEWSQYAEIAVPEKGSSQFFIKPYSDTPPLNKLQLSIQTEDFTSSQLWGIKLQSLISFLNDNSKLENISAYFRKRLLKVWSVDGTRQGTRQALIEPVELVMGVSNISHFLGNTNPETEIHELYKAQFSRYKESSTNKGSSTNKESSTNKKPDHGQNLPVFRALQVDESELGCRVKIIDGNQQFKPVIDEVIAVKHQDGGIHVGYLRWIKENKQKEVEIGVEHLSSMAESVQLVLSHHQDTDTAANNSLLHSRILDSFVFPGGKAQHFKPVLFTHSFIEKFADSGNHEFKLIHKTGSIDIKLTQKVDEILDYNLYLFDKADSTSRTPTQKAKTKRFDKLWDKL